MKKVISIAFVFIFCSACGPKRMKCYGKRCVNMHNLQTTKPNQSPHS
ncbi:MAG: hypothetical protein NTX74_01545 [Flavobacterium sp.]|nr:hypothetical protein [Flavobacterium sp.]